MEADVREGGAAGVSVTALLRVVLRARDAAVVGGYDSIWDEEEGGSCVSDTVEATVVHFAVTDSVAGASEAPKAPRAVDVDIGDFAGMSAVVNGAEAVGARLSFLKVAGEEWS